MMKNRKNIISLSVIAVLLMALVIFKFCNVSNNMDKLLGSVYPESNGVKISCDNTSLEVGGSTTCTLAGYMTGGASGVYGKVTTEGGITVSNIAPSAGWTNYGTVPFLSLQYTGSESAVTPSNQFTIATMTVTATSASNGKINFVADGSANSVYIVDSNDSTKYVSNAFCSINVSSPTPQPSSENRLSNLTISNTSLSFNPDTTTYNLSVDNSITSVNVNATAMDGVKSVTIDGAATTSSTKSLNPGNNTISIVVTAQNDLTRTYTININRGASANNNLRSLSVTNTNISSEFNNSITTYSKDVINTVTSVKVTATPEDSGARIIYKNNELTSLSETISLSEGNNTISFAVRAANGTTKNFTININRLSSDTANVALKTLKVTNTDIESKFKATTLDYTATVANNISSVKISATAASGLTISGTGSKTLKVGDNVYSITVTNQSGSSKTYTVKIKRQSQKESGGGSSSGGSDSGNSGSGGNSNSGGNSSSGGSSSNNGNNKNSATPAKDNNSLLKNITINNKEIMLSDSVYKYNFTVVNSVTKLNIVATAKSDKSKVIINKPDKLDVGQNVVTIKVTAEDGSETTYKIIVTRKDSDEELSSDSKLTSLSIENYDLVFDGDTYDYELKIKNESKLKISYVASGINTNVIIKNNSKLKNNSIVSVIVTAEDGVSTSTYNIRIKKSISPIVIILIILLLLGGLAAFYFFYLKNRLHKGKEIPVGTDDNTDFEEVTETPITEPIEVPTEAATEEPVEVIQDEPAPTEEKVDETTNN